jgi:hypothetical protein
MSHPIDPENNPELRQLNLPIPGLPVDDNPRGFYRSWINESNRSIAKALQEAVRRVSNMTDDEYFEHLAEEYEAARKRAESR